MKRVILFMFVFFTVSIFFVGETYCTDRIEPYTPTKEELEGIIKIPNKDGGVDTYTEINTYEDLYSVLEDLSYEYNRLLEDYHSSERNYEDLAIELQNKNEEVIQLQEELKGLTQANTKSDGRNTATFIIIAMIGIVAILVYYSNK